MTAPIFRRARRTAAVTLAAITAAVAACSGDGGTDPTPGPTPTTTSTMATSGAALAAANGTWTNVQKAVGAQGANTAVTLSGQTGSGGTVNHTLILVYAGGTLSGISYSYGTANPAESGVFACDRVSTQSCNIGAVTLTLPAGTGPVSNLQLQGVVGGSTVASVTLAGQLR